MSEELPFDNRTLEALLSGAASLSQYNRCFSAIQNLVLDFAGRRLKGSQELDSVRRLLSIVRASLVPKDLAELPELDRLQRAMGLSLLLTWCAPEYFLRLGFDQVRYTTERVLDPDLSPQSQHLIDEVVEEAQLSNFLHLKITPEEIERLYDLLIHTPQFRTPNGVWHDIEYATEIILPPEGAHDEDVKRTQGEWLRLFMENWVSKLAVPPSTSETTAYMPALSVPLRNYPDIRLQGSLQRILRELASSKRSLSDLSWRTLEELIAELLFNDGFEVHLTKRSHDGGRDVIARGEFLPGEPCLLAVEAKQMAVFPVAELRAALWANRHFPALLFVTSGSFSAGVFKEKMQQENVLRLYLKDGMALQQWINAYAQKHPW